MPAKTEEQYIIYVGLLLVGAVVGFLVSGVGVTGVDTQTTLSEAEAQNIADRLVNEGIAFETGGDIQGTVLQKTGDSITVEPSQPSIVDVILNRPSRQLVEISEDTTFVRRTEKPPEQLDAEFEAYDQRVAEIEDAEGDGPDLEPEEFPEPPEPFTEEEISLNDIEEGDSVVIIVAGADSPDQTVSDSPVAEKVAVDESGDLVAPGS